MRSRPRSMTTARVSRRKRWSASSNASIPTGRIRASGRTPASVFRSPARSSKRMAGASAPRTAWACRSTRVRASSARASWCDCPRCEVASIDRRGAPDESRSLSNRLGAFRCKPDRACRGRDYFGAAEGNARAQAQRPDLPSGDDHHVPHELRDLPPRRVLVSALVRCGGARPHRRGICLRALQAPALLDALAPQLHDRELLCLDWRRRERSVRSDRCLASYRARSAQFATRRNDAFRRDDRLRATDRVFQCSPVVAASARRAMSEPTIHASAVLIGARAVLIRGPAGSGKSRLALELIQAGGILPLTRLVGDDRVYVEAAHSRLLVRPAEALTGLI